MDQKEIRPEVLKLAEYASSKDYKQLAMLARQANIICIVDYAIRSAGVVRDVGQTQYSLHRGEEFFQITARGIGYVSAFSEEEFIAQCEHRNVEFIVPSRASSEITMSAAASTP